MIGFLGEFESTLDSKGRFLLPAGLKKQMADEDTQRFVINRGFEECLALFPIKTWEPLFTRLSLQNDFEEKARQFRRQFLNGATFIEPDSAGRLLLPPSLKSYAGMEKDIIVVAAIDKFEIWDSNKYKKQLFDSFSPDAFSKLANEVMGEKKEGS